LLATEADLEAIICSLDQWAGETGEFEFLVDRRVLKAVKVLDRYQELP